MRTTAPRRRQSTLLFGLVVLLAATAVGLLVSVAVGNREIPLSEVLGAIFQGVDSDNATVITSQRLPRTLAGLAVGAALGMAGALMQGHTRNPLADPGLFGVNAGAAFAIAIIVFGFGLQQPVVLVLAALIGAGVVSAVVFLMGLRRMDSGGLVILAVAGTAVSALLTALTSALVLLDAQTLDTLRFWSVGSLQGRQDVPWAVVIPLFAIGAVLAIYNSLSLTLLGLGDDVAASLGTRVRSSRMIGIAAITLLAGTGTAVCGPIAFLGMVGAHAARLIARHDYRWLVPMSALTGASLILWADTIGRVVVRPEELQVGVVLSALGAPVLLTIARRRRVVSL